MLAELRDAASVPLVRGMHCRAMDEYMGSFPASILALTSLKDL